MAALKQLTDEGTPMVVVTLRVSEALVERIDAINDRLGLATRSHFMRTALESFARQAEQELAERDAAA